MKQISSLIFFVAFVAVGFAQHGFENSLTRFSNTTNYVDVNRANFVVTNGGSDLANYHYSVLKLGTELAKFGGHASPYNAGAQANYNLGGMAVPMFGRYTAYRTEYTEPITLGIWGTTRLRCIIVRPNTALPNSPMVLISHGTTGTIGDFGSNFIVQVADLLMRGYVVTFYENLGSSRTLPGGTKIHDAVAFSGLFVSDPNYTQHLIYLNGEAAAKLAAGSVVSGLVGTDPGKLFTLGFSLGSGISSTVLLGKRADFSPTLNTASWISPKDEFTYLGGRGTSFNVRGAVVLGGSLAKLKSAMTDIVDPSDANKRWLSIFGTEDFSAYPYNGSADWDSYQTVSSRLSAVGIKHYMNPICGAGHSLFGPGTSSENLLASTAMTSMLALVAATAPAGIPNAVPSTNAALNDFKKMNTQSFQIGSTAAKFISLTLANSTTAMNFCENSEHIKCQTGNLSGCFCGEPSWLFSFANICGGIVYNYPCTTAVSKQVMSEGDMVESKIMAYPNPASRSITLESQEISQTDREFKVMNAQGVQVQTAILPNGISSIELDLSSLSQGIYFVRLQNADGSNSYLKILKQ